MAVTQAPKDDAAKATQAHAEQQEATDEERCAGAPGPEPPLTWDTDDEKLLPLKDFNRVELKCGSCGRDAVAEEVWTRYLACCGKRMCRKCHIKLKGDDGEDETPLARGRLKMNNTRNKAKEKARSQPASPCPLCSERVEDTLARVRQRAESGDIDARYVFGTSLVYGLNGCERQPLVGCKWLTLAARAGRYDALFELGICHREGWTGHRANPTKAARIFRRAAARGGHAGALYELSLAYYNGNGVGLDKPEAVRLLTLAADADFTDARKMLARLCIDGDTVEEDRPRAARLLGLERTAELLRDGIRPPNFLFGNSRDSEEAFAQNEYTDAEMDAFFDGDDAEYDAVNTG